MDTVATDARSLGALLHALWRDGVLQVSVHLEVRNSANGLCEFKRNTVNGETADIQRCVAVQDSDGAGLVQFLADGECCYECISRRSKRNYNYKRSNTVVGIKLTTLLRSDVVRRIGALDIFARTGTVDLVGLRQVLDGELVLVFWDGGCGCEG